ncbi:hypothetical protein AAF712_009588 [Marasmius tenuissimus]|uniref:Uncharacterized protein n=1 Tax=Marasmius tenuissimus TaxID=585030 RepID=A0ABR2ZR60_9AGAR
MTELGKIIEGAVTIAFGMIAYFFIPDFPDRNNFLSAEETKVGGASKIRDDFILARIDADRGDALPDDVTTDKVLKHLRDWILWAFATTPAYAISGRKDLRRINSGTKRQYRFLLACDLVRNGMGD